MRVQPEREWVGLRPGRKSVRLELEEVETQGGQKLTVVHNYGEHSCPHHAPQLHYVPMLIRW